MLQHRQIIKIQTMCRYFDYPHCDQKANKLIKKTQTGKVETELNEIICYTKERHPYHTETRYIHQTLFKCECCNQNIKQRVTLNKLWI